MVSQLLDGRYQIIEVIETGEFGQTYLAKDTRRPGEPQCFVKHLRPAMDDPKMISTVRHRFEQEAEALEKLGQHDQIPQLFAYFENKQEFFLVEAYIPGHSLASEILPGQPLSEERVIGILKEVLEILVFVHKHGVIHRDIKPGNLIHRESDGKLVLIDFGAVKEIHAAHQQKNTSVRIGTAEYMPLEQFEYNPQFNSDLYALGMIAIQALTGLPTYELPKLKNYNNSHNKGEIAWHHLTVVGQELANVIDNMVRLDYRQRYQSASEALADLKKINDRSRARLPQLAVYREEVERRTSHRGEITVVGRKILDELRNSLELMPEEAEAIEDEVLNPYRKYQEKGQRYEQALLAALQQERRLSAETRDELKRLQQILGLTDADTARIEERIIPKSLYEQLSKLLLTLAAAPSNSYRQPQLNPSNLPSNLNGSAKKLSPSQIRTLSPQSPFQASKLRSTEWQLLGVSLAVILALMGATYGYFKWQETQKRYQQESEWLNRIQAMYTEGNYEGCMNVVKGSEDLSTSKNAQSLLKQCESGIQWKNAKVQDFAQHSDAVGTLAFSPNGRILASGSRDATIKVWDVSNGQQLQTLSGDGSPIWTVGFNAEGTQLVTGSFDWRIMIWDLQTGQLQRTVEHNAPVWSVAMTPDEKTLVSGSGDRTVKIWNLETGSLVYSLPDNTDYVYAVAITPDGKTLVTGSKDKTINILDLKSAALLKTLQGHFDAVRSIAITPDGKQIISGSYDTTIKIWDLQTGELIKTLRGHQAAIVSVAISPDGKTLASGSKDNTIKLWNVETGELLNTLTGHSNEVYAVVFSPDGKTIASGSKDRTIKLWHR